MLSVNVVRANPTAIVTYSHSDPGWTPEQEATRSQYIVRLVAALRTSGIDADADIFHQNEDWTRWGPSQVQHSDYVLIVVSKAWKLGWEGSGDPGKHRGTRAETDAVRSLQHEGHDRLQERCRLLLLPDSTQSDIPYGLHGLMRHTIRELSEAGIEDLLRDLTGQPRYVKSELGPIPILPPAFTASSPDAVEPAREVRIPLGQGTESQPTESETRAERISKIRRQLEALPLPLPGEGPHLPWYRLRLQLDSDLADELQAADGFANPDEHDGLDRLPTRDLPAIDWRAETNFAVTWTSLLRSGPQYGSAFVALHLAPIPVVRLSQRLLESIEREIPKGMQAASGVAVDVSRDPEGVLLAVRPQPRRLDQPHTGQLLGCRVERTCQVSIWYSLPSDNMGAILEHGRLTYDLRGALSMAVPLLRLATPAASRVVVAAELVNTTVLTDGKPDTFGSRTSASLTGAFRLPTKMEPEESVPIESLEGDDAVEVARTVATVLVKGWAS
jgi:hypothetical protein